jgi:hypothetical protein
MFPSAMAARLRRAGWPAVAALGFVAGIYVWLAFFYLPPGVYWSPDIGYKRVQAENVRLTPWLDLTIDYPGRSVDPELEFVPFRFTFYYVWQGRIHFAQPPVIAVLSRPFIAWLGDHGERVIPVLAGLAALWLAAQLTLALDARPAWAGILIPALATPVMIYSLFLWEHILGVALGLGALWLVVETLRSHKRITPQFYQNVLSGAASLPRKRESRNSFWMPAFAGMTTIAEWKFLRALRAWGSVSGRGGLLLSGLLMGLAAGARKELMLFAPLLGAALARRTLANGNWRRLRAWTPLALWAAAALSVLSLYELYSVLNSGSLIPPEFRISVVPELTPRAYLLTAGLRAPADFIFDPQFGWLGDVLLAAVIAYWIASRGPRTWVREAIQAAALAALLAGVWNGVRQLGAAGGLVGLLSASPFLVVGLNGEGAGARRLRRVALGFYALVLLNLGLLTAAGPYQTGLEWGSRFALIVFPLSAPLVVNGLSAVRERAARSWLARVHFALALSLVGLSIFIQLRGVSKMRAPAVGPESRDALLALPERQVVTNLWWLSAAAPRLYLSKELFLVASEQELRAWMEAARSAGVRRFAFVSYVPLSESVAVALAPPGVRLAVLETVSLGNQMIVTHVEMSAAP